MTAKAQPLTEERLLDAHGTLRAILEQDTVVRAMFAVKMIGKRLVNLADAVIANDLKHGWEIDLEVMLAVCNLSSSQKECSLF